MKSKEYATLNIGDKTIQLPVVKGAEGELGLDITRLRDETGYITLDPGYANTGSCYSRISFVDGEKGILRYRGYPIEQLAEHSSFTEVALLLIFGELPSKERLADFSRLLTEQELLHEDLKHHFEGFPPHGHPMAMLSAIINSMGCYHPELLRPLNERDFTRAAAKLISRVRTIAAFSYKKSIGHPFMYPDPNLRYCNNFLHMMFSIPNKRYEPTPVMVDALSLFLIVHADHEQNCSTSTVRMVGSSQANVFASVSAGICALWGRLHGGANSAVIRMLRHIRDTRISVKDYVEQVKTDPKKRLMGFGHRVYKNFDPRALILKKAAHKLLLELGRKEELLEIAEELEQTALNDDHFVERKLYPNVDFYSGIILKAMGIPVNMFPVMFAIGRMPGWIANWYEESRDPYSRIHRPRQIYMGETARDYIPVDKR